MADTTLADGVKPKKRHPMLSALLAEQRMLWGGGIIALLFLIAIFAPLIAPHDPLAQDLMLSRIPPVTWPGAEPGYYLGTDDLGRDVLSRLIYGTRIALTVAVIAAGLAAILGSLLGLLAGAARRAPRGHWLGARPSPERGAAPRRFAAPAPLLTNLPRVSPFLFARATTSTPPRFERRPLRLTLAGVSPGASRRRRTGRRSRPRRSPPPSPASPLGSAYAR